MSEEDKIKELEQKVQELSTRVQKLESSSALNNIFQITKDSQFTHPMIKQLEKYEPEFMTQKVISLDTSCPTCPPLSDSDLLIGTAVLIPSSTDDPSC